MIQINEEILEKYGIHQTRTITREEETKILKIKKEIEKLVHIPVERIYAINDFAWGKEPEKAKCSICILVDKRLKDLDAVREILVEYIKKQNIEMIFWTLCQFEKRKNAPTEEEYYIDKYGIKIYDSEKKPQINENIKVTEYAMQMEIYRTVKSYIDDNPDYLMENLVRIYTLKIGYAAIGKNANLKRDIEFVRMISKDKKVLDIIDNYLNQTELSEKRKVISEFEKYLKEVKQVKYTMKLEENPTMKVYEKLLKEKEKKGILDIKSLTKDDLYTMYIIQGIGTYYIAQLYGVENKVISSKRENWDIKLKERSLISEDNIMSKVTKSEQDENERHKYVILKEIGIMDFEKYILQILEYMSDNNVYLLREFWRFTKGEKIDEEIKSDYPTNPYYKISMCMDLLLQNELVKKVDFEQYKITKKGKELIEDCQYNNIEKIDIPVIAEKFGEVKYYNLYYTLGYPTEPEEVMTEILSEQIKKENKKQEKETISIEEQASNLKLIDQNEIEIKIKKNLVKDKKEIKGVKLNYSKIEEAKSDFGTKCENIVYDYEIKRLKDEGREDKAKDVIWVSRDLGDGFGYDIESFENVNGTYEKIYIEVKGTDKECSEPFDVSINEVLVSEKYKDNYYIYRIAKANTKNPVFYKIKGSIAENFELTAVKFKAAIKK